MARFVDSAKALAAAEAIADGGTAERLAARIIRSLVKERDLLRKMDREAATHVESVICMRTEFTGEPPYTGWKGLGLALSEALDERDRLRVADARPASL